MSELDRDLRVEALEDALGDVIDEPKVADAAAELARLKTVSAKKAWLEAGRYRDAEEALRKSEPADDEANDHACALAWLALSESRVDYWPAAVNELVELRSKLEARLEQLDPQRDAGARHETTTLLEQVRFNLERVRAAREAAGA